MYIRTLTSALQVRLLIEDIPRWGNPAAVPHRQGLHLGMDYGARAAALPPPALTAAPAPTHVHGSWGFAAHFTEVETGVYAGGAALAAASPACNTEKTFLALLKPHKAKGKGKRSGWK